MGFAKFMTGLANTTESFRKAYASKIGTALGEGAGKVLTKGIDVGVNLGAKAYVGSANLIYKGSKAYIDNEDEIKKVGKAFGDKIKDFSVKDTGKAIWEGAPGELVRNTGKEAAIIGETTLRGLEVTDRAMQKMNIWKKTDFDDSLIRRKLSKGGVGLFIAGGMAINAVKGTKESLDRRQGRNDGRIYSPTPTMTNPYTVANQMMSTQIGQSFANNGGADGDLIRAVHNMR
jgi:hypothetical protein